MKDFGKVAQKKIREIEREIQEKVTLFEKGAKQCNFCGGYYGSLSQEIDELKAMRVILMEVFDIIPNTEVKP